MHPADIICALSKAGYTQSSLADEFKLDRSVLTRVIYGTATSHDCAYAVAAATGIQTEKMWPGKYLTPPAYKAARKNNARGRLPEMKEVANG